MADPDLKEYHFFDSLLSHRYTEQRESGYLAADREFRPSAKAI
jgi:hypothetical protein